MDTDNSPEVIDVSPVVDWLVEGAPGAPLSQDILLHLATRLIDCGIPLHRSAVFVTTLHPNVMGRAFFWREGETKVEVGEAQYSILDTDEYKKSPIVYVSKTNKEVRRHLANPDCPDDFSILQGLRDDGVTDYLMTPLEFTNGEIHGVSWSTRQPSGFNDQQLTGLRRIQPALSRLAEIMALKRLSRNLLDAYLGHQSGEKVLSGKIKRGDGEDILAVIWFCDLRGSTTLADTMPRPEYLALLNQYFECMAGAILDGGGEVLKYIGDAVLGIFPIDRKTDNYKDTCSLAIGAANDAIQRMKDLNKNRLQNDQDELFYGIGLHLGEVMYGNIGTPERIEFGVIGAAVNEASRIEGMTKLLKRNILISGEVAQQLDDKWHSLGHHSLRGVGEEIELFIPHSK
ncbi:MAG: adenylate/guanylate cyclase domain-containing protein [Sneathiella sp.]|nr:adenylate/guanylate cyclase domain-containing protein [Sneathiella sp.]